MKKEIKKEEKKMDFKRIIVTTISVLILFIGLIYIYARYVGTTGLKVREYNIKNENIPESFDGFSILQFSDLEYNTTYSLDDFECVVDKINEISPDIVVFTGDLVKATYELNEEEKETLTSLLNEIDPLIGKYSIKGDDDFNETYDEIIEKSGFKDISNDYELIYYKGLTPIVMYGLPAGVKDYDNTFSYPNIEEDTAYMATYRILLAHEPDTLNEVADYNISLMLAGHSHNSELNIPYIKDLYDIKGAKDYYDKSYKVNGTELYVSSGLGTSKFKVRLFDKPSISIYRLYTD